MYIICFCITSFATICSIKHIAIIMYFFFNDTATTKIYTLSLHDALPISFSGGSFAMSATRNLPAMFRATAAGSRPLTGRSEEHTSELQSRLHLVCRLLLEKKKKQNIR